MALINFARREIEVKIVFYGPAFSGKTTNVEILHRLMPPTQRGELQSLRTEQDRTLFFDYVPMRMGEIAGFTARFKLFTVPGQVFYKETRRLLLQGADAVVFVADSTPDRAGANVDALVDLEDNLRAHGLDLRSIPLVIQLNKRDVAEAPAVDAMTAELNPFGVPVVEAVASEGRGVLETLRRVTDIAGQRIRENLSGNATAVQLTAIERAEAEDEREVVRQELDRIREVRPAEDAEARRRHAAGQLHAGDVDAVLSELVVRSEDVTPPEPIPPMDGPFDEMPVPRESPRRPAWSGGFPDALGGRDEGEARGAPARIGPDIGGELTPVRHPRAGARPPPLAREEVRSPLPAALPSPAPGGPLDAWLDAPGDGISQVRDASVGEDGSARLDLVLHGPDGTRRQAVILRLGAPPRAAPEAPRPVAPVAPVTNAAAASGARPAPAGLARWIAFGGATLVAAIGGAVLGIGLGWLAFAG